MKKKVRITSMLLVALLMISSVTAMGQRGRGMRGKGMVPGQMQRFQQHCQMIPDLTEEQQSQIDELRVGQMKEMTSFRNRLMEKRAHLRTLQTKDNPDMNAINQTIEEMGQIRTNMHKALAEHRQNVREVLNEDQRAFYDARIMNRRGRFGGRHDMGRGHHGRPGRGMGSGMGTGMGAGMQTGTGYGSGSGSGLQQ